MPNMARTTKHGASIMKTKISTGLATALFAYGIVLFSGAAHAADKELLDILLGNGAITQAQYDELLAKPKLEKQDVEQVEVNLSPKGFTAESADGETSIKIGTRLHFQASAHSGDLPPGVEATDGTELRRARIETSGKFYGDYKWAAEVDFADNNVGIRDFKVGYAGIENTTIYIGNQKQPYSLSVEMSSNDIPFIERSIDNNLIIPFTDRALGVRVDSWGENWFVAAGLFGEGVNSNRDDDEGAGAAARFVYAPVIEERRAVHLGVRAALRTPSASTDAFRIRDETTHQSNLRIVDTGTIGDIDKAVLFGAEAAIAVDQFSLTGEYNNVTLERDGASDLDFSSWHVYGAWTLTGESRASTYAIKSGEFKRIHPAHPFNLEEGHWGAWEVALRYANIDLNDGSFTGGEETVLTSALNWYLNRNMRLMLEYSTILDTDESSLLRDEAEGLNIFQFRTQYTF